MIVVDLSKQQALDADPKAIQQINFTPNLDRIGNTRIYLWRSERTCVRLFTRNRKSFVNATPLNKIPSNNLIFINIQWIDKLQI